MLESRVLPQRRLPVAARAIVVLLIGAGLALLYAKKIERRMPDYEVYRRAAARAARAEPLYRPSDGHYQFKFLDLLSRDHRRARRAAGAEGGVNG